LINEVLRDQFSEPQDERGQPPPLELEEQPDSRTAPGAAELVVLIFMSRWAAEEEQLLAQSLSLTAPGAVMGAAELVVLMVMGHWAAEEEQLLAQSLPPTAPGAASLLLQHSSEVLQQEAAESFETAPRAAESSVVLLLSQAASKLRRAAAARVVRVRVMIENSSECLIWPRIEASVQWVAAT
jgi:hypothetical protein